MSNPVPEWSVQGITPTIFYQQGMGPVDGYNVNFVMRNGTTGTVFVAKAQVGDTAFVAAAVQREVDSLNAIHNLGQ
jgi:hypothetical protein